MANWNEFLPHTLVRNQDAWLTKLEGAWMPLLHYEVVVHLQVQLHDSQPSKVQERCFNFLYNLKILCSIRQKSKIIDNLPLIFVVKDIDSLKQIARLSIGLTDTTSIINIMESSLTST